MSLLDQNWGASGNADEEIQDENQQGRQVKTDRQTNQLHHPVFFLFPI